MLRPKNSEFSGQFIYFVITSDDGFQPNHSHARQGTRCAAHSWSSACPDSTRSPEGAAHGESAKLKETLRGRPLARTPFEEDQVERWTSRVEFWDNLSKVWLTRHALREVDRRNSAQPAAKSPAPAVHTTDLARFARHGGPGLDHLRGVSTSNALRVFHATKL